MTVYDKHIAKSAHVGELQYRVFRNDVPISQADIKIDSFVPGVPFEIVKVETFARTVVATSEVDVDIGTTLATAAVAVPVAGAVTNHALATLLASRRGSATDAINVHVTTDGTGVLADLSVVVRYRVLKDYEQ